MIARTLNMLTRTEKRCPRCQKVLPLAAFYRNRSRPDGLENICKICSHAVYEEQYLAGNRKCDPIKEKLYYYQNRERILAYQKAKRTPTRAPRQTAAERLAYKRRWARQDRKDNPEKNRAKVAARRARRRMVGGGGWTATDVHEIYRLQRGRCALCPKKLGKTFHQDHIVPLARGGKHERRNLQLTCPTCNLQKAARDPIEHAQSLGLLL
jgi:5-methylcytosine-specific restriction endonuclease McrA